MSFVTANGARYFVEQRGQGPQLLLLHGFTGSGRNWHPILPALIEHFQVTLVDILGHGRSDSPTPPERYRMTAVSADLITLLDQLEIEQCHLLGYSMGGRLALFTAVHYPSRIRSLTLESSSPGLATEQAQQARRQSDETLADWIEAKGIEAFVNHWERLSLWESQKQLSDKVRHTLRQQRLTNSVQGLANSLRGMGTGAQPNLWPYLDKLMLPTLQIVGELDDKFVQINQNMAQQLPNTRLIVIPQAGHTVHLERPSLYTQHLTTFLTPI